MFYGFKDLEYPNFVNVYIHTNKQFLTSLPSLLFRNYLKGKVKTMEPSTWKCKTKQKRRRITKLCWSSSQETAQTCKIPIRTVNFSKSLNFMRKNSVKLLFASMNELSSKKNTVIKKLFTFLKKNTRFKRKMFIFQKPVFKKILLSK